jgi:hypothetical protein
MLGCGSSREHTLTDQALAKSPAERDEHLANLIRANGVRASLVFVVSSHVA